MRINVILALTIIIGNTFAHADYHDIMYLFCHGLGCNATQSHYYEKVHDAKHIAEESLPQHIKVPAKKGSEYSWYFEKFEDLVFWVIKHPIISFNFPDAHAKHGFDRTKTSLGQQNEILALSNAYHQAKEKALGVILVGMSRGASVIINFLGLNKPEYVVAAIVESPFDSVLNALQTQLQKSKINWIPDFIAATSPYVLFGKYNRHGIYPIDAADKIQSDLPILIICSLEDTVIPAHNSAQIYLKLQETNHDHAYLLILNKGIHGHLLWHADGDLYLNCVHAFYKKYGLAHNPTLALHGEHILAQCQPSKKMVEQSIASNVSYITR